MSKAEKMDSITAASGALMTVMQDMQDLSNNNGVKVYSDSMEFTNKDLILYALGIGATVNDPTDLKYLYESHADFTALPTYFIMPSLMVSMTSNIVSEVLPNSNVDLTNILHGEQYLEVVGELPLNDVLHTKCVVTDILDKRSGAVVIVAGETFDSHGNLILKAQSSIFAVGAGGFGAETKSQTAVPCLPAPKRTPDSVLKLKTTDDQAALYRLSGDLNPLHIDPQMSMIAGYKKPILHGLCTLGFSVRAILKQYANNNPGLFKSVKVRFTKPVLPGQTLRVDMWQENNRIYFLTSVVETGDAVITGAYVDLKEVTMSPITNPTAASLQSDAVFLRIKDGVAAQPDKAKSVNAVFLYNITDGGKQVKQWTLDLKGLKVYEGAPEGVKADTTLTVSDSDMLEIALGKLNPQVAFMKGKLKITGNIMLTQKLVPLLKAEAKL